MRVNAFNKMKPKKQVELIEKIDKSLLGLDGMYIVVECDKGSTRNFKECINFERIGHEILENVNGNTIKEKYKYLKGEAFGDKLTEERIKYIKNFQKSIRD